MLIDAKGNRLDKGPINIVSDPKRPDRAVTNGVSCMSCHYGGIISKADEIRKTVEANPKSFKGNTVAAVLSLYPEKKEVDELYADNAARFRKAVQKVGIKELTETGEPIREMSERFEEDVDARSAAAELGLKLEEFLATLKANLRVQDRLGPLNVEGGIVKRDVFAKEFAFVVEELRLGEALKPVAKAEEPKTPPESPKEKPPALRLWSDVKSNTAVEAEFVNLDRDKVELRKADGSSLQLPLADLSPTDRKFVEGQLSKALDAALPPGETLPEGAIPPRPLPAPSQAGPPAPALEYRLWRNVAIRKNVRAAFVSLVKGDLKLQEERFKGAITTWPMEHLAPEDHEYVKRVVGEDHYEAHKDLPPGLRGAY